ncbi:MAG: hypothetical protein L6Q97_15735 [Thermoanaerobaculia bacterium]|nr:hypothetical protein [Thermoanaerobaculia bacterium]
MLDNIIILDIIIERGASGHVQQSCNSLTNTYFSTNASANTEHTFSWGPFGGLSGEVKLTVGSAGVLVAYNGSTQQIEAFGTCADGVFEALSVDGGDTLHYSQGGFSFFVKFHLVDGAAIEITVIPENDTTIAAAA